MDLEQLRACYMFSREDIDTRGGVEDLRLEVKAKDRLSKDRPTRGQAPRTQRASVLQKKKKKFPLRISQIFREISGVLQKKRSSRRKSQFFREISDEEKKDHDLGPFLTNQTIVLSSAEDRDFRGLGGFEAKDVFEDSTSD